MPSVLLHLGLKQNKPKKISDTLDKGRNMQLKQAFFEIIAFRNRGAAFVSMYKSLPPDKVSGFSVRNSYTLLNT